MRNFLNPSPEDIRRYEAEALKQAKAPLKTIDDCWRALDIHHFGRDNFAKIQLAYRSQLYRYDEAKFGKRPGSSECNALMLKKVKEAYTRISKELHKDPEEGLEETEERLIAERDRILDTMKNSSCGTPALETYQEYDERINALKKSNNALM